MKNIKFYKDILLYCSALFPISQLDVHIHKFFMLNACVFGFGFSNTQLWARALKDYFLIALYYKLTECIVTELRVKLSSYLKPLLSNPRRGDLLTMTMKMSAISSGKMDPSIIAKGK